MKRYILFMITILVVLGTVLVSNMMIVNENINKTFNNPGYVLKNSDESERYFFDEESTYKNSYNNQIVFDDTEGEKVVIDKSNFIHYNDGSISSFTKGVLLNLDTIETEPITYYNISANKILKRLSNGSYVTKNLDKELQFTNLMWRISENKYLVAGNSIKIVFTDGTEQDISGYLEIEYSENEIVKIFNQEVTYKTISSDVYLKIDDTIKINLGTKIISKNDVNEMTLENMVIDSNDNVTIIDMEEYKEDENEEEEENNQTSSGTGGNVSGIQGGNSSSIAGGDSTATGGTAVGGTVNGEGTQGNDENNTGSGGSSEGSGNKEEGSEPISIYTPKYTIKEFEVTATRLRCKVAIEDEEARLTEGTTISIIDNSTGKIIDGGSKIEPAGKLEISIDIGTLSPDKEYTLIMKSTYKIEEIEYTKNFIHKIFRTPILGLTINKDVFTDESLVFNIDFESDSAIKSINIALEDPQGQETIREKGKIENNNTGKSHNVKFENLTANKEYILKISNVVLSNAATQEYKTYEYTYKTLKKLYEFNDGETTTTLTVQKNERDSTFELSIPELNLEKSGIETLNFEVYTISENIETIIYNKTVSKNTITLEVNGDPIARNQAYHTRVYASLYDNEKTVEYLIAQTNNSFIMDTRQFPTLRFEEEEIQHDAIKGTIIIEDNHNTVDLDSDIEIEAKCQLETAKRWTAEKGSLELSVNINNLRKGTTYKLLVYGNVDLGDGNGAYKKTFIGSVVVNTKNNAELKAKWVQGIDSGNPTNNIKLNLQTAKADTEDERTKNYVATTLEEISIELHKTHDIENIENTLVKTVTFSDIYQYKRVESGENIITEDNAYRSSLKDNFYDKEKLIVENNMFCETVALEDKMPYTIVIKSMYDYTTNTTTDVEGKEIEGNKIVIKEAMFEFTSGVALEPNPENPSAAIEIKEITKADLKKDKTKYVNMLGGDNRSSGFDYRKSGYFRVNSCCIFGQSYFRKSKLSITIL